MPKLLGVNLCGAEFGTDLPGTLHKDYEYPGEAQFAYYASKGLKVFRLPFKWERVQRWTHGGLNALAMHNGIYTTLDLAQKHGCQLLLEPHNFGRFYGVPLITSRDDIGILRDFWSAFVDATSDHPATWGYELIGNEPHDLIGDPVTTWRLDHEVAEEVRSQTTKPLIWAAPGWQSARFIQDNAAGFQWLGDTNSSIGVHVYGDGNSSGSYKIPYAEDIDQGVWPRAAVTPTTMADRLQYAVDFATQHSVNLYVTEFGVPQGPEWLAMLEAFLAKVDGSAPVLGGFAWAGGPWWGDYPLSLEPNADGTDKPQMTAMLKHL